jgi:DNA-binding SARP family transcriptional activator
MTGPGALEVRLLGRFVVMRDGREIAATNFGGRKVRALLRILVTRRGEFVSNDVLSEMLWGDRPPADPGANLQVLVNRARRALGRADLLMTGTRGYSFAESKECVLDTELFLQAVAVADASHGADAVAAYRSALAHWRGEPLAEDAYADWAVGYRDQLLRVRQHALERAAQLALDCGLISTAVEHASTAAALEPLREVAVLTFMRALGAAGDRVAALERYEQYRHALAEDLGLDPSRDARTVHLQLLKGEVSPPSEDRTPSPRPDFTTLPFVGRSAELARLTSIVARGGVVLLAGASGTGKSRLLAVLTTRIPILLVRAFLAERDEPWSLLRGLLREILAQDATAASQLPAAIRVALGWLLPELDPAPGSQAEPDAESRRFLLLEAAFRLLAASGATVVVDDLQWADASSLWLLQAAAPRLTDIGAVLAYRPEELLPGSAAADLVTQTRSSSNLIDLGPFELADIGQLSADDALTTVLATATDRTPLAVTEVLRTLAAEDAITPAGAQRWRPRTPGTLDRAREIADAGQRAAIVARAATQQPRERELINLLALVAREVPARALALATSASERDVLDRVGTLSRNGLARLGEQGWATSHDMVSDALVERLSPSELGRLHAQLAQALSGVDAEPGELARHWHGAGDTAR